MKGALDRAVVWVAKGLPPSVECWMHHWVHARTTYMNGQTPARVECQCGKKWEFE